MTPSPALFTQLPRRVRDVPAPPSLVPEPGSPSHTHHCLTSCPWAGMSPPGTLTSPPLGHGTPEKRPGALGLRGPAQKDGRRTAGCRITRQPPEMESVCLTQVLGWGGGRGRQDSKAPSGARRLSLRRPPCRTGPSVVRRLLQEESGAGGRGGGSQGAREADVTNFSSAPGWPEAAWDFPEWKDSLGSQATWGHGLRTPSPPQPVLSADEAAEVKGNLGRPGVPSWGPPSVPEPPRAGPSNTSSQSAPVPDYGNKRISRTLCPHK